jgi:hypothetical protein
MEAARAKGFPEAGPRGSAAWSERIAAQHAQIDALRAERDAIQALRKPQLTQDEKDNIAYRAHVARRVADLQRRMAAGDFAKRVPRQKVLDQASLQARADMQNVIKEFKKAKGDAEWERMAWDSKAGAIGAAVYDSARLLMTTAELSFVLRQGKLFTLAHPIRAMDAFGHAMRALASENVADLHEQRIKADPDYDAAIRAKVHFTEHDTPLSRQEETLAGKFSERIPIARNFNRAARVFLNEIRLQQFKMMRKAASRMGTPTAEEDAMFSRFANESTGRGGLGKAEPAAIALARIFFSPRYFMSRLQMATGHAMWGGTVQSKKIIAGEYARIAMGYAVYYSALMTLFKYTTDDDNKVTVGADMRSTKFGRVTIGNTTIDPLAGFAQFATLAGQLWTGERVNAKGEVKRIRGEVGYGQPDAASVMGRFLRTKLHPVIGSTVDLLSSRDVVGRQATLAGETATMVSPITYADVYQALKEQNVPTGTAMAALAFLGEGLYTKQPKSETSAKPTRPTRPSRDTRGGPQGPRGPQRP